MSKKAKRTAIKKAKAVKGLAMAMGGASGQEIADELGMSRNGASKLLNGVEAKAILMAAESKVVGMITKALGVVEGAMDAADAPEIGARGTALKAALDVLHSSGVLKKNVKLEHAFPKPTVIKYGDGTRESFTVQDEEKP